MKHATFNLTRRIILLILILSIALTGCAPTGEADSEVKVPNWVRTFKDNIAFGLSYGKIAVFCIAEATEFKIGSNLKIKIEYLNNEHFLRENIRFTFVALEYKINGIYWPRLIKGESIVQIGEPAIEYPGLTYEEKPFVHEFIMTPDWFSEETGIITFHSMLFQISGWGEDRNTYFYIKDGDTIRLFKEYSEFYEYQQRMEKR